MDPDSCISYLQDLCDGVTVVPPSMGAIIALILAILLLYASGFVSASEIAFFSLSPSDLSKVDENEHPSDSRIRALLDDSERLLATILISNNFVNVTIIMLCNFFFASVIDFGDAQLLEFLLITVVLTFLLLLFGEIMPKIYSAQNTLKFCRKAAPVVYLLRSVFKPVSNLLVHSTFLINKLTKKRKVPNLSVDELSQALELTDKNEISEESNMLKGIIRFGEETAEEVMTSRLDIVDLEINTPFPEVIKCIVENAYSRIPVYEESRDNIKGVLYIKDLLPYLDKGADFKWQNLIRPAFFVPETKMIDDLLRDFQANKIHIAIVVDEFGGTSGIVTMEDIIEEIVGEINDEYDEEERTYVKISENVYIFEGKTLLSDFYKLAEINPDDFEAVAGDADTLAGLLLELKGEFPVLHEVINYDRYRFEILEMDVRRIVKVKVTVGMNTSKEKKDRSSMPLLKKWIENGALFAIWRVEETAEELRKMLVASLPYDEELSQLKSEARQLEYLAVRVLLRAVCGEEKHISHYSSGKPFLTDGSFHITISHTRGYVAVGLHATYEVGVDIEYISNRVRKVAGRFMYPDELRHSSDTAYLLVQWSAKETMYKLLDEQGVDFLEHLRIVPFQLQTDGRCEGHELRTSSHIHFDIHYIASPDFVCTWCVLDR